MKISFVLLLSLIALSSCQPCLDNNGNAVTWWVKLLFPGSVPGGYAYLDSTFAAPSFVIYQPEPDSPGSAMYNTLNQINTMGLQTSAWNDQMPNGTTSSTKAHSKGLLAYNQQSYIGFFLCHSIPQYPAFNGFIVNITINSSETIYGQHAFCLSVDAPMMSDMITKLLPIKPFIFATNLNNPNSINSLMAAGQIASPDYTDIFTYRNYTINGTQFQFIYKNGAVNASIFEDGMNNMLQSPLLAETWGRPIEAPWCGSPYPVGNVVTVRLNAQVAWNETQDHSKWAYATANNYSCFGDMNRMSSQWKRGGAFYCINSPIVKQALVSITAATATC